MDRIRSHRRQTGLEAVKAWAAGFETRAEAAGHISLDGNPIDPRQLTSWMWDPNRGFTPSIARAVALGVGIPIEAVLFKHERICDLACERARSAA